VSREGVLRAPAVPRLPFGESALLFLPFPSRESVGVRGSHTSVPPRPRRQVPVDRPVAELRHERIAITFRDEPRDRGIRIAEVAEVPCARRARLHASRL